MRVTEGVAPSISGRLRVSSVVPRLSGQLRASSVVPRLSGQLRASSVVPRLSGQLQALSVVSRLSEQLGALSVVPRLSEQLGALSVVPGTTEQLRASLVPAAGKISSPFADLGTLAAEAFRQVIEAHEQMIGELDRYADALERDATDEYRHAGVTLRKAVRGFEEAVESDDEYAFADVVHWAVGALEEIARQLAGNSRLNLRQSVTKLERAGRISRQVRAQIEEPYDLRNESPGVGHGAGGCPEYVASFALFAVRRGLDALIPSSAVSAAPPAELEK